MFSPGSSVLRKLIYICVLIAASGCLQAAAQTETTTVDSVKTQEVTRFGVVVDNSGAFRLALEKAVRIISAVLRSDRSAAEGFLVTYADSDKIRLKQDLTSDRQELIDAVENMYAESGNGAFLDAVKLAADHLKENGDAENPGYLLIAANGEDRGSSTKVDDLLKTLKASNVRIFIIGISDGKLDSRLIDRIVKETGGKRYLPLSTDDVNAVAATIRADIDRIEK